MPITNDFMVENIILIEGTVNNEFKQKCTNMKNILTNKTKSENNEDIT